MKTISETMSADLATAGGVANILRDELNKKYDDISNLDSLKITLDYERYTDMLPIINSIIEDDNEHIGKLEHMLNLVNPAAHSVEVGKEKAIDELDENFGVKEKIMASKLVLDENFDNVQIDATPVATPAFIYANKEHDENKKKYDDAMKANQKLADETIVKSGQKTKKIKSQALKKMHLSESLFDDVNKTASDIYQLVYNIYLSRNKRIMTFGDLRAIADTPTLNDLPDADLSEALIVGQEKINPEYPLIIKQNKVYMSPKVWADMNYDNKNFSYELNIKNQDESEELLEFDSTEGKRALDKFFEIADSKPLKYSEIKLKVVYPDNIPGPTVLEAYISYNATWNDVKHCTEYHYWIDEGPRMIRNPHFKLDAAIANDPRFTDGWDWQYKINEALDDNKEQYNLSDFEKFESELYRNIMKVCNKYESKGLSKNDIEKAIDFFFIHAMDTGELDVMDDDIDELTNEGLFDKKKQNLQRGYKANNDRRDTNLRHKDDKELVREYDGLIKQYNKYKNNPKDRQHYYDLIKAYQQEANRRRLNVQRFNESVDEDEYNGYKADIDTKLADMKAEYLAKGISEEDFDSLVNFFSAVIFADKNAKVNESLNESVDKALEVRFMEYVKKFQEYYKLSNQAMGELCINTGKILKAVDMNESLNESILSDNSSVSIIEKFPEPEFGYSIKDTTAARAYFDLYHEYDNNSYSDFNEYYRVFIGNPNTSRDTKIKDSILASDFLMQFDNSDYLISDSPVHESIKFEIAKEQLQRFNEGKMPKNWNPNLFLENLVKKNHITLSESIKLKKMLNER